MKKKFRFTLGKKMVLMILVMSVTLCTCALFVSYRTYWNRSIEIYQRLGQSVAQTLASQLDPEDLDRYYETGEMDEDYFETQQFIMDLVDSNQVEYLYVVRPNGTGVTFLFDSDMETGTGGEYEEGGYCSLGSYVELVGDFAANLDKLLMGENVDPIVQQDENYGWLMTAMVPVLHEDGTMAGYVMVDISMNAVMQEQRSFLLYTGGLLVALTLVFTLIYLLVIRRSFIQPLQKLTDAARQYEGETGNAREAFDAVQIRGDDEIRTLSDAFRMMLAEIGLNAMEQQEMAVREQQMESELQLANELHRSMLPKELPHRDGGYPFRVCGQTTWGESTAYTFYDYFLLGRDQLCIILSDVPGSGISGALFTVMARTALKSQLSSGLPLGEAMTAANRQMYEMSSGLYMNALVGVLDGTTGQFYCINAGQPDPLLMRSQGRYEWMKMRSYAPLGQSENVVYQVIYLELHQGDRLFFHSRGLDEITDKTGTPFAQEQLRQTLNENRNSQGELEQQMKGVSEAGASFAGPSGQSGGYAMLALEYRRRDKAQAHCLLDAVPAQSGRLRDFLRGQLEANGIFGQRIAALMVAVDELFTLCCRQAVPGSRFMAECAIPSGEGLVVLRLKGDMQGKDPLKYADGTADAYAADFIRTKCDRVLIEHDDGMDTVTVVKRMEASEAAGGEKRI
ncbi:MAG: SpoIIE family protein phosphatase [Clostridiales bacterium]|nr:SpoIIE family protein phosphatase [Clostridiales bacterium]